VGYFPQNTKSSGFDLLENRFNSCNTSGMSTKTKGSPFFVLAQKALPSSKLTSFHCKFIKVPRLAPVVTASIISKVSFGQEEKLPIGGVVSSHLDAS
tara:strand:+ start:1976 stop:2266 length:291 start_codon:yes stop_codon:yes gene_type:complete